MHITSINFGVGHQYLCLLHSTLWGTSQLRLGRQRQVWFISITDDRAGVQVKLWKRLRTRAIPERFCYPAHPWLHPRYTETLTPPSDELLLRQLQAADSLVSRRRAAVSSVSWLSGCRLHCLLIKLWIAFPWVCSACDPGILIPSN